jgi:Cu-Zn family superoxide dismutase
MGKHFAPTIKRHGLPTAKEHHLGDLGNITVDRDGEGRLEITVLGANLKPNDPHSFLGKSIVIHEGEDKGLQPSGGSGTPMACAVIKES